MRARLRVANSPSSGSTVPARIPSSVDFPEPLGPISPAHERSELAARMLHPGTHNCLRIAGRLRSVTLSAFQEDLCIVAFWRWLRFSWRWPRLRPTVTSHPPRQLNPQMRPTREHS